MAFLKQLWNRLPRRPLVVRVVSSKGVLAPPIRLNIGDTVKLYDDLGELLEVKSDQSRAVTIRILRDEKLKVHTQEKVK